MATNSKKSAKTSSPKTKPKTKAPAKSKKKKKIDPFAGSKEVATETAKLKELHKSRKELENNMKDIIDTYNSKSVNSRDGERFLDKLPLDTLKEFNDFSSGKQKESSMEILKLRTKLRKDKELKENEIYNIENKIAVSNIDVLLAKINHLIKSEGGNNE